MNIQLADLSGRVILEREVFSHQAEINTTDLEGGIYVFRIKNQGAYFYTKWVKLP